MTFPSVELKFSSIQQTASATTLTVRLYRVDNGGLDAQGHQLYARTLLVTRTLTIPANATKQQMLAEGVARLAEWAVEFGFNVTQDRLLCSL